MNLQLLKHFKPRVSAKFYSEKFNESILTELNNLNESTGDAPETPLEWKQRLSERFSTGHNHLGASILPETLQSALNRILKGYPRHQLRQDVSKLAESYAKMTKVSAESLLESNFEKSSVWSEADRQALVEFSSPAVEYGPKETYAYIASQLPFMFAPLENVFAEIVRRIPGFAPKSMLDFGSGPGTAIIAAQKHWNSCLQEIMAVEISQSMLEISAEIIKDHDNLADRVELRRYMAMNPNRPKYNLVVSSVVLSELADDHLRQQSVDHLWQQTDDILVLIDRGNAEGFRILRNARDWLIKDSEKSNAKLHIVAPVPANSTNLIFNLFFVSFSALMNLNVQCRGAGVISLKEFN
jgi:ribosomal protein RSM22 (predicted rRNA methylase)